MVGIQCGRMPVLTLAACATQACWIWRQGPPALTGGDDVTWQVTCRFWLKRHVIAVVGPGGTCHVSPGQTCRHPLLTKNFRGSPFLHFIGVGGPMCQKFVAREGSPPPARLSTAPPLASPDHPLAAPPANGSLFLPAAGSTLHPAACSPLHPEATTSSSSAPGRSPLCLYRKHYATASIPPAPFIKSSFLRSSTG
jgi:hypothetical protein